MCTGQTDRPTDQSTDRQANDTLAECCNKIFHLYLYKYKMFVILLFCSVLSLFISYTFLSLSLAHQFGMMRRTQIPGMLGMFINYVDHTAVNISMFMVAKITL